MSVETVVLLVDETPEYLDVLALNLPGGCRALTASSSDDARLKANGLRPALAVLDVRLNEADERNCDGLDLLKWLRARHPDMPIILISACREFEVQSLALGAELFLSKPIQPMEFRKGVMNILSRLL